MIANTKTFIDICKMTQPKLHKHVVSKLSEYGYTVHNGSKWVLAEGSDILVTAHMDTVHEKPVKSVTKVIKNDQTILSSPQGIGGDDRCGVFMILELLRRGYRPTVLFTEDEEIGGIGAQEFIEESRKNKELRDSLENIRFMIELDRAHAKDAVFYDCDNPEFTGFVLKTTGYKEEFGSFTDISYLAPHFKKAAVNLSCGYYKPHTLEEYVVYEEMMASVDAAEKLLNAESEAFEYIESEFSWGGLRDVYYSDWYSNPVELSVTYSKSNEFHIADVSGETYEAAMFEFFADNPDICFNDIVDIAEVSNDNWRGFF